MLPSHDQEPIRLGQTKSGESIVIRPRRLVTALLASAAVTFVVVVAAFLYGFFYTS
ncbi:hypothetical protein ACFQFC_35735 [Amorphoplanes digitatis]|uniref:Uncharacterized protein n=1 Tax=Actinoplanes digitatis TaxID=1868 RepID=A0A7W7MPG5_9ACTN|nr:hypothetical protein [Actinoplanes digitatis]MBB4761510.1 hypothetical protein [Actinoplanes digitatis]